MIVAVFAKYSISPNSSKQSDCAADGHHILTPRVLVEYQSVEPWLMSIAEQSQR